jgi:DNA-binding LytR/AlgR family response regulator
LDGYEHDVADYLLKPITLDRFMIAVQKAKDRMITPARKQDHIFIKTEYRIQRVDLAAIHYIEALRDYVAVHTGTGKILSLESMKHMEEMLPEDLFIRIHKSYIINCSRIDFLERGRVVIGKEYLPIGDTYKEKVRMKLGLS